MSEFARTHVYAMRAAAPSARRQRRTTAVARTTVQSTLGGERRPTTASETDTGRNLGGLISIEARCEQGRVREVRMRSLAAFVGKVTSISDFTITRTVKKNVFTFARKMSKSGCQVLVR